MRAVLPPAPPDAALPRPWLFLAGAIDQGRAERWQDAAVAALADLPGTALNPRREAWDAGWGTDLDDPRFADQVAWELDALEAADLVLCWLPAAAQAPVSLLEIGLHARRGRLIVGCEPGFHRRGNVRAVCARYTVPVADTFTAAIALVRHRLGAPP